MEALHKVSLMPIPMVKDPSEGSYGVKEREALTGMQLASMFHLRGSAR